MKRKYRKRTQEDYDKMKVYLNKSLKQFEKISENEKLHKLISVQEKLIEILSDYYRRTENICVLNRLVQEEMFSIGLETLDCFCCEEPHYPILTFIHDYEYISKNYESLELENLDLHLKPTQLFHERYYRHSDVHPSEIPDKYYRHKN